MIGIDEINRFRVILASKSPRRQELLRELGIKFELGHNDLPEDYPPELKGSDIALYLAREKSRAFTGKIKTGDIIITADTIVWCKGKVLGKPADKPDARRILRTISGNTHEVITGVCFLSVTKQKSFCCTTRVTFSDLTEEEIEYYISNFNPYDKAGAYGIQEWIGLSSCSHIEGSYFNVMGLPVEQVYHELTKFIKGLALPD